MAALSWLVAAACIAVVIWSYRNDPPQLWRGLLRAALFALALVAILFGIGAGLSLGA